MPEFLVEVEDFHQSGNLWHDECHPAFIGYMEYIYGLCKNDILDILKDNWSYFGHDDGGVRLNVVGREAIIVMRAPVSSLESAIARIEYKNEAVAVGKALMELAQKCLARADGLHNDPRYYED